MKKDRYLWYTDLHLNTVFLWTKAIFIKHIIDQNPKGIFITGDISNGLTTCLNLKILATFINCPIYFILGNHDYFFSSFEKTHDKIRQLCQKYPNLIWISDQNLIKLNQEAVLIGTEGWYDTSIGNSKYIKYTFDWFMIEDFRKLPSMNHRIKAFQNLAEQSCSIVTSKLERALKSDCNTIYLATHFPPWQEAGRDTNSWFGKYHLAYDINYRLGQTIEKIMVNQNKKLVVLAGHTHHDSWVHVSHNIECKVNAAKYYTGIRNEERIFI